MEQLQEQILVARGKDPKQSQRLCRQLRTRIKMKSNIDDLEKNRYAQCFADTYLCESHIQLGEMSNALKLALKTVNNTIKYNYTEFTSLLCNFIGIAYACMEDYENSTTWFMKGLECTANLKSLQMQCMIQLNIGENYYYIKQYEKAKEFFCLAKKTMDEISSLANKKTRAADYYAIRMALVHMKQKNVKEAIGCIDEIQTGYYLLEEYIVRAAISVAQKDFNEAENVIAAFLRADQKKRSPMDLNKLYQEIFELVIQMEKEELAERVIKNESAIVHKLNLPNSYVSFYENIIRGSEIFGWTEGIDDAYENFFAWNKKVEEQRRESVLLSLRNQMTIYQLEGKEKALQKKVQKLEKGTHFDELTKVYNSTTFMECLENTFKESREADQVFGYAIVEIDEFDTFNERIGTDKANQCLVATAKALKDAFLNKGTIFRNGGAEFIVITKNVPTLSFLQSLEKIVQHKNLDAIEIEHGSEQNGNQNMTLSIGAINAKPKKDVLAIDYAIAAEKLLYIARQEKRTNYQYQESIEN